MLYPRMPDISRGPQVMHGGENHQSDRPPGGTRGRSRTSLWSMIAVRNHRMMLLSRNDPACLHSVGRVVSARAPSCGREEPTLIWSTGQRRLECLSSKLRPVDDSIWAAIAPAPGRDLAGSCSFSPIGQCNSPYVPSLSLSHASLSISQRSRQSLLNHLVSGTPGWR